MTASIPASPGSGCPTLRIAPGASAAEVSRAALALEAPYVALVGADVVPGSGWTDPLRAALEAHPEAAAATARLVSADGSIQSDGYDLVHAAPYPVSARARPARIDAAPVAAVPAASTDALLVRTSALRAVGGLDEELGFPAAGVDLCLRFRERGWQVLCASESVAVRPSAAPALQGRDAVRLNRRWVRALLAPRLRGAPALARAAAAQDAPLTVRPSATVVLAAFDAIATVAACLDSLLSDLGDRDELILADGGSADGTAELFAAVARHAGEQVQAIAAPTGAGLAAAVAGGVEAASRPVLLLVPATVAVPGGFVTAVVERTALGTPTAIPAGKTRCFAGPTSLVARIVARDPGAVLDADESRLARAVSGEPAPHGTSAPRPGDVEAGVAAFRAGRHEEAIALLSRALGPNPAPGELSAAVERAVVGCPNHDHALPGSMGTSNVSLHFDSAAVVDATVRLVDAVPVEARRAALGALERRAGDDYRVQLALARLALREGRAEEATRWARAACDRSSYNLTCQQVLRECEAALARATGGADRFGEIRPYLAGAFCEQPWRHVEIGASGDVHLCCSGWLPPPAGNVFREPFPAIWNSEAAQAMRAAVLDGSFRYCNPLTCHRIGGRTLAPRPEDPSRWPVRAPRGPAEVFLNHDASCNLACPQCRRDFIHADAAEQARLDRMLDLFLEDALRDASDFLPNTMGEVFFSKHSRRMLKRLSREAYPDLKLNLISNGQLFDRRAYEEFDLRGRIVRVTISVDAARPETYRIVRRGGDFGRLLENLSFLDGLRVAGGDRFELCFAFAVSAHNFEEMPEFVQRMSAFHPQRIGFSLLLNQGTYSPAEYHALHVASPDHPRHAELRRVLRSSELADPRVDLGSLGHLARSSRSADGRAGEAA